MTVKQNKGQVYICSPDNTDQIAYIPGEWGLVLEAAALLGEETAGLFVSWSFCASFFVPVCNLRRENRKCSLWLKQQSQWLRKKWLTKSKQQWQVVEQLAAVVPIPCDTFIPRQENWVSVVRAENSLLFLTWWEMLPSLKVTVIPSTWQTQELTLLLYVVTNSIYLRFSSKVKFHKVSEEAVVNMTG